MASLVRHGDCAQSSSNSCYSCSKLSDYSQSTAPSSHDYVSRPFFKQDDHLSINPAGRGADVLFACSFDPRASTETYASTIPSDDEPDQDAPEFLVREIPREALGLEPIPSTPPEFAELFPSSRRLRIRHDDTTEDGNMNLRLDTEVPVKPGRTSDFTLFHLRMYDLKRREFSLRRYCRDSGREICHTSRRYTAATHGPRPVLQKSVSSALASLRWKQHRKQSSVSVLQRQDSGYETDEGRVPSVMLGDDATSAVPTPTDTMKLDFSNYAHVDLRRRGTKNSSRYEFEYWGFHYSWKRSVGRAGEAQVVSYHLVDGAGLVLAHVVPIPLTAAQEEEEASRGGWVPPCSLWISHEKVLRGRSDVAE